MCLQTGLLQPNHLPIVPLPGNTSAGRPLGNALLTIDLGMPRCFLSLFTPMPFTMMRLMRVTDVCTHLLLHRGDFADLVWMLLDIVHPVLEPRTATTRQCTLSVHAWISPLPCVDCQKPNSTGCGMQTSLCHVHWGSKFKTRRRATIEVTLWGCESRQLHARKLKHTQRSCPGCAHATCGCSLHASPEIPRGPSPGMQRAAACPRAHVPPLGRLHRTEGDFRAGHECEEL